MNNRKSVPDEEKAINEPDYTKIPEVSIVAPDNNPVYNEHVFPATSQIIINEIPVKVTESKFAVSNLHPGGSYSPMTSSSVGSGLVAGPFSINGSEEVYTKSNADIDFLAPPQQHSLRRALTLNDSNSLIVNLRKERLTLLEAGSAAVTKILEDSANNRNRSISKMPSRASTRDSIMSRVLSVFSLKDDDEKVAVEAPIQRLENENSIDIEPSLQLFVLDTQSTMEVKDEEMRALEINWQEMSDSDYEDDEYEKLAIPKDIVDADFQGGKDFNDKLSTRVQEMGLRKNLSSLFSQITTEKETNIPTAIPRKLNSLFSGERELLFKSNRMHKNEGSVSVARYKKTLKTHNVELPSQAREFTDPAVEFAEIQMNIWNKMRQEVSARPKNPKNINSMTGVVEILQLLRSLGMSPTLINRVDKSTLFIVLKIKLWRKRAIDRKAEKSEPLRRLITRIDRKYAVSIPPAIEQFLFENAIVVLEKYEKQYSMALGSSNPKSILASEHLAYIKSRLLPIAVSQSPPVEDMKSGFGLFQTSHSIDSKRNSSFNILMQKIYDPVKAEPNKSHEGDAVAVNILNNIPSQSRTRKSFGSNSVLPAIRRAPLIDDVLVKIDED